MGKQATGDFVFKGNTFIFPLNNIYMIVVRVLSVVFLFSILIIAGCVKDAGPNCVALPGQEVYTVNAFDESDSSSKYFGKNVANFIFTESVINYTGAGNCPDESCGISLQIRNLVNQKVTFNYTVSLTPSSGAAQFFQGTATMADSGANYNVGSLSSNCSIVTAPTTTVQLSKITYQ